MSKPFQNRTAIITGGARGIGLAIAQELGQAGANLILSDIDQAQLEKSQKTLTEKGFNCEIASMDVTNPEQVKETIGELLQEYKIDILINNAGIVFGGEFQKVPTEKHDLTLDINLKGLIHVTHALFEHLAQQKEAHIVTIASASGFMGLPFATSYAASKWGAIGFTDSLRAELNETKRKNVAVLCVCPSYVNTGLFEGAKAPLLTPILTPERLARKVVKAMKSKKAYLKLPWSVHLASITRGTLPTFLFDWVSKLFGASQSMAHWKGHEK